ncbi:response regulator transcription factor [bacterium]|nr:response regulator transcription factor [bacterium]
MRVLVIEDYRPLRDSLTRGLREAGYAVDAVADGETGQWRALDGDYDVIVLDLMLPGIDGLSILRELRAARKAARVLILTAKDTVADRVAGLEQGADDYLVKPFAYREFLARVQALVRRRHDLNGTSIAVGDLILDLQARTATRAGSPLELSAREFALLEFLVVRRGRVQSRTEIWEHLYDFNAEPNSNVIDVYVGMLRRKLERDGLPRLIHTRRGMGYVLEPKT